MAPTSSDREAREAKQRLRNYQARQTVHASQVARRRRDNLVAVIVVLVVVIVAIVVQVFYFSGGPGAPLPTPSTSATPEPTATPSATPDATGNTGDVPPTTVAQGRDWTGTLTLNDIPLAITLDGVAAPQAVSSFISLVQAGFYTGLTCHRLTTEGIFVLQCGDPNGDGTGGPGYTFGPLENVPKSTVTVSGTKEGVYPAGTLAMARGTATDSQGSQFFIVYKASELPAPGYTVFGKVTSGLSALKTAITSKGTADGSTDGKPKVATTLGVIAVK